MVNKGYVALTRFKTDIGNHGCTIYSAHTNWKHDYDLYPNTNDDAIEFIRNNLQDIYNSVLMDGGIYIDCEWHPLNPIHLH